MVNSNVTMTSEEKEAPSTLEFGSPWNSDSEKPLISIQRNTAINTKVVCLPCFDSNNNSEIEYSILKGNEYFSVENQGNYTVIVIVIV